MKPRKPTKTISGVAPLAVMLPPRKCDHGTCTYCPTFHQAKKTNSYKLTTNSSAAPQSYTPQSPAVIRARECNYDPIRQIKARLNSFKAMRHPTEKIELIIMGGTFLSYPKNFQIDFITKCYQALNQGSPSSQNPKTPKPQNPHDVLQFEKKRNETANHRCVALCIETRPDVITASQIKDILSYGATRVELGVQAISDEIYKKVNRGHTVKDVITATKRLKEAGFKIGYHLMPGLPGSNPKSDIQMFKKIFSSTDFKPDQIKIYPCQVLKGASLENLYYGGEYIPYSKNQVSELIIKMLKLTPRYCRIMRIMREIPPQYLIAGILNIDMRHDIEKKIKGKERKKIKEIRFREIGFQVRDSKKINTKLKLKTTKYKASGGTEYFIEITNPDNILFGLLRLRLDKLATIRELHVYGQALNITKYQIPTTKSLGIQHLGLGKFLLKEAEKISRKKYKKIRVISGVGVRNYYKSLGYKLDNENIYMEKLI